MVNGHALKALKLKSNGKTQLSGCVFLVQKAKLNVFYAILAVYQRNL
jgi:hypothetical protein